MNLLEANVSPPYLIPKKKSELTYVGCYGGVILAGLCLGLSSHIGFATEPFIFTITADSHLDYHTDREFYQQTLKLAAADKPAFHVDLGDTFMSEKLTNRAVAAQQYLDQRRYFDLLGTTVHLAIGNHDGESGVISMARRTASPHGRARCG